MIKLLLISIFTFTNYVLFIIFLSFRVIVSWNIGVERNLLPERKSEFGFHHVVLTNSKTSPKKFTITVVEQQQEADIE